MNLPDDIHRVIHREWKTDNGIQWARRCALPRKRALRGSRDSNSRASYAATHPPTPRPD